MGWTWYDRDIAETAYQEMLDELSPDELAEMVRRQDEARQEDYFDQAFDAMRGEDEALGLTLVTISKKG